jgi:predicted  nucleic acid-binding Zn-ribbon protein
MNTLKEKFIAHKEPLDKENETLKKAISSKQLEYQKIMQETKEIRKEIDELNLELTDKEALLADLSQEMASNAKENSRGTNRQFYTKRILEIVETIDKQRKEIDKVEN